MRWIAFTMYTLGLVVETAGFLLLYLRAREAKRAFNRPENEKVLDEIARNNTGTTYRELSRLDLATTTAGWPLGLIGLGLVFGYAGNYLSLFS